MRATAEISFHGLETQRALLHARIDAAIGRVLAHGQFIHGAEVAVLEEALAARCGTAHAIACASGTHALMLALLAQGLRPGDTVVVPGFTFAATAGAVAVLGARPWFADVERGTANLDPEALDRALSEAGPSVRGVIPVDLYGLPADYASLAPVAAQHGCWVVADAAQSFGATRAGHHVGTLAPLTSTSFYPSKPLGAYGEGGALFTDDPTQAAVLRSLRDHGSGEHSYDHTRVGLNARLDSIQAAVLLEKLTVFDAELAARRAAATRYDALLDGVVELPVAPADAEPTWAQYTVRVADRHSVIEQLDRAGIPTRVHYPRPLHRQPAFATDTNLPVAEWLAEHVLSLPMHAYLVPGDQERVAAALAAAVRTSG